MNFTRFSIITLAVINFASCSKNTSNSTANTPNNFIIINGIKHQLNYSLCAKTDSSFYIELDSVSANGVSQPIFFSYAFPGKIGVSTYPGVVSSNNSVTVYMTITDSLLGEESPISSGSLSISSISNGLVSGTFSGTTTYQSYNSNTQYPLVFSGVFANNKLVNE